MLGAQGMLGQALVNRLRKTEGEFIVEAPSRKILDITEHSQLYTFVNHFQPHVTINCAAIHDAKICEAFPELAEAVNVTAVEVLVKAVEAQGGKLIQISTDQVLKAPPNLQYEDADTYSYDVYTRTKRAAELAIPSGHTIIRVSALYGHTPCRGKPRPNFVEQIVAKIEKGEEIELPDNTGCSPGYVDIIAVRLLSIVRCKAAPDIIHLTPRSLGGAYSWFKFGCDIAEAFMEAGYSGSAPVLEVCNKTTPTGLVNMDTKSVWYMPLIQGSLGVYFKRRKSER